MRQNPFTALLDSLMHRPVWWTKWLHSPPGILALKGLPKNAKVLDVGCYGFRQVEISKLNDRNDIIHFGIDHARANITALPEGFSFQVCDVDRESFPFPAGAFDYVVACHILEHVRDPLQFMRECCRVCKPGGLISVETPSERSLFLPGFPFQHDKFMSLSFYDDPTHFGRPWTSQGLYRLARSMGLVDIHVSYDWSLLVALIAPVLLPILWLLGQARAFQYTAWKSVGWNVRLLARRPTQGFSEKGFSYVIPHRA